MSRRNRKDCESDQQEDSSMSMQVDESHTDHSHDPSEFEGTVDQFSHTPSSDRPAMDDESQQMQSSGESQRHSLDGDQQSSPKEATSNDQGTSISEVQTGRSTTRSRNKRDSSSVEDVDQEATEMPRPVQRTGRGRRGRGRRGRGGGGHRGRSFGEQEDGGRRVLSNHFSHLDDEANLLDKVIHDPTALKDIVGQWIGKYKANKEMAMRMLMQFFVSSCGSNVRVTLEMQTSLDHNEVIRLMTENYYRDDPDYPLVATGHWKKFREIYSDFVFTLVCRCQHAIIYDQYLMDKTIALLNCLTDSQIQAFRHTSTFAVMKLMSALVDVAVTVSTNLANCRRQYESERRKALSNKSTSRLENLEAMIVELDEHMQELREMLDYTFESVFVHRYADVATDIRIICFTEIGLWIKKNPAIFFDDRYLEYISDGLWDEADEVRLICLGILRPLYESEDFGPKLENFTAKYKDRIVAMTLDRDFEAAAEAVRLVTSILKSRRDILTDIDCEKIYLRVYSANREVAHAAGEFVNEVLSVDDNASIVRTKSGKPRLPNKPVIRDLITFFIESEKPDHAVFLVDSLIDTSAMKDWECMTDLLLEDAGPDEETLDDKQETCLVEIMVCCAKQAATGEPPVGRESARKNVSAKQQKQAEDDKRRVTVHFVTKLAPLLFKYEDDARKIVHLLALPQYFDIKIYRRSDHKKNLDDLMERMYDVVKNIHDTDVLETSAKTLASMCAVIPEQCDDARVIQLDYIVESYREVNERYTARTNESATPDDDERVEFVYSLRKVAVYYSVFDLNSYGLWEDLWKSLEEVKFSSGKLPDEAVKYCITACYYSILWSQNRLMEAEVPESRAISEARLLTERLHSFVDLMVYFVGGDVNASSSPSPTNVREVAYNSICDVLIFFNRSVLMHANVIIHQLVYQPDDKVRDILNRFVIDNVFCDEPDDKLDDATKVEYMFKRRNFLAGYCKLVMYNAVPINWAIDVFKNYVKHHDTYGDIVKETISRARDNSRINCARTMLCSLLSSYDEMAASGAEVNRSSEEFAGIKKLAKKFALLFSFEAMKNSEALLALHGDGLNFAVAPLDGADDDPTTAPRNLPFLEILSEFSGKLSVDDRVKVLDFVEKKFEGQRPLPRDGDWKPLYLYVKSLSHGAADQISISITDRLFDSRSSTDHVPGDEKVDEADKESANVVVGKPKRTRRSRKSKLPVTIVKHPRETGTSGLSRSNDIPMISGSQMTSIDGAAHDVHRENESRLESLQIDPPNCELFEDVAE